MIGIEHYIIVSAILFVLGVLGIFLNRKNIIVILMAIELILLAVNINLVAFSAFLGDLTGQVFRHVRADRCGRRSCYRACNFGDLFPWSWHHRRRRCRPVKRLMGTMVLTVVFLPLLAAIVGGLGNRMLGNTVVKSLTTGALFVAAVLSWIVFTGFWTGSAQAERGTGAAMDHRRVI